MAKHHNETSFLEIKEKPLKKGFSFVLRGIMGYRVKNTKILTPEQLVGILHRSAALYSEYANTTLLFIFREKKSDEYDYYG